MSIGKQLIYYCTEKKIPFLAGIELTNCCNLHCKYCYVERKELKQMDFMFVCDLLRKLKHMGTRILVLTGGDIFCRQDIRDIIHAVEKEKMFMVLYTNGTIPLYEYRDILESHWILRIEITVYGASENTYMQFCGNRLAYQKLRANMELLKKLKKNVLIKIVPTQYNKHEISAIKQMASEFGFEISINTLVIGNSDLCHSCVLSDGDLKEIVKDFKKESICKDDVENRVVRACGAGRYSLCIDCNGEVKACFISTDTAGSLYENDIQSLWDESKYFKHRREGGGLSICKKCEKRGFCFTCTEVMRREEDAIKNGTSELCRQAKIREEIFK